MANYKVFNDPIHSSIQMPKHCQMIIDTPEFQRLRFIKQLGCTCYVFPSAVHTRFEHSIGVSHLAGKLAKMLQQDDPNTDIQKNEVRCVEIAGLCHDLGHGPYFRAFEDIVPPDQNGKEWTHEKQSVIMFEYMIEHNDLKEKLKKECSILQPELDFICELILGRPRGEGTNLLRENKFYLHQIVNNRANKIDVNKWDYFARDALYIGMKSAFDFNRIMPFIKVFEVERGNETRKELCFRDKVVNDLSQMFLTRRRLYYAAYRHRVTDVISLMLKEAFRSASDHLIFVGTDGVEYNLLESVKDPVAFCLVNDTIFNEIMRSRSQEPGMRKARAILDRINKRELYQCIGTYRYASDKPINRHALDPAEIKQAIVNNNDNELWHARNIEVEVSYFDYGDEERNPLLNIPFYRKSNGSQGKGIFLSNGELPIDLPQRLQDVTVTVYTKVPNINRETLTSARNTCNRKLHQNEITRKIVPSCTVHIKSPTVEGEPSVTSTPIGTVNPMKSPESDGVSKEKEYIFQATVKSHITKSVGASVLAVTSDESIVSESDIIQSCPHPKDAKDELILKGSIFIDLTNKSYDASAHGEITVEEIGVTPPDMPLKDDEVVISSGLQLTSRGSRLSAPVTIKMAHSAIFTNPKHADIVFYYRDNGSDKFKRLSPSDDGCPRCVIREKDLDLFINHFSQWWIVALIRSRFIGKRFICTPYIPTSLRKSLRQCIYMFLIEDIIGLQEETLEGFRRAFMDEEFRVKWHKGDLKIECLENGMEVETKKLTERELRPFKYHHVAFELEACETRESRAIITFNLKQDIAKEIKFHVDFEGPTQVQSSSSQAEQVPRETQERRLSVLETERKLDKLAEHVPTDNYVELCSRLGTGYNAATRILKDAGQDHKEAIRKCLAIWKTKTMGTLDDLKQILIEVDLRDLQKHLD